MRRLDRPVAGQGRAYVLLLGIAIGLFSATLFVRANKADVQLASGPGSAGSDVTGGGTSTDGGTAGALGGGDGDGGSIDGPAAGGTGSADGGSTAGAPSDGGGADGGTAGGGAGSGGGGEASGGTTRGITADAIKIGIGIPDVGVLSTLGPNYSLGDPEQQMRAVHDHWKRAGLIPVHGRDVQFVYRTYDIVTTDEQRAACQGWAKDDKVMTVIAITQFWGQAECLTVENRIPLVTSLGSYEERWRKSAGYLFDLQISTQRVFRNWVQWAERQGMLEGKRIGLYYGTGLDAEPVVALKDELKKVGRLGQVVSEVQSSNIATGSPEDGVAVQRFRSAGVDLAWLVVGAINQTNFMQQAQAQLYKPTYLASDYFVTTNDTAASTFPAAQYDGTLGITHLRFGEIRAGMGMTGVAQECVDNYARYSGRRVDYQSAPAEWMAMQQGCDEARVVLEALRRAGPDLTVERFVDALYATRGLDGGVHPPMTIERGVAGAGGVYRTVRWHASCTCWKAQGAFAPNFY